jgi:hypothetical protein
MKTIFLDAVDYDILPIEFLDELDANNFRRDDYYSTIAWFNSTKKTMVYLPERLLLFKSILMRLKLSDEQKEIADKLIETIDFITTYKFKYQS